MQYKAALAITGAIHGTSRDKLDQELGLESLKPRRWYKCLCCIYKIMTEKAPNYLINLILKFESKLETTIYPPFIVGLIVLSTTLFFPSTLNDWFSLGINIRNSESISLFKGRLLSFFRPVQNNT